MSVTFECETNIGQKRQVNEDSFWPRTNQHDYSPPDPYGMLFIVADGMGGHGAGDVASGLAVAEVSRQYYALGEEYSDIGERLQLAIQAAHQKILERAVQSLDTQNMGTTIVAAVVKYDEVSQYGEVWVAWAGDSRVYLLRRGRFEQLTRDHSRLWPLIETGQITWDELRFHPDRSRIINALAAHRDDVIPEILSFQLEPGDQLLLCSDGLSGEVRPEEIAQIWRDYPPRQALQRLIEKANASKEVSRDGQMITLEGGNDNITSIIITIPPSEAQTAVLPSLPTLVWQPAASKSPRLGLAVGTILVLLLLVGAGLFFVLFNADNSVVAPQAVVTTPSPTETSAAEQNSVIIAVESEKPILTPTLELAPTSVEVQASLADGPLPTVTRGPTSSPTAPPTSTAIPTATVSPLITSTSVLSSANPADLPTPILLEPGSDEAGKIQYNAGREVKFVWQWPSELTDDLSFEIRVWLKDADPVGAYDARLLRQNPTFQRLADNKYSVALVLSGAAGVTQASSDYFWSVSVVRVQPEYEWLGIESGPRQIS
ncbi:MAG TPA: protein phosphatase 2C domain-containing protein, partial [Anaerolineae bacterium]|nr:protein phosphatase 2C domain-containing protein [Anaerolineae bacterium]